MTSAPDAVTFDYWATLVQMHVGEGTRARRLRSVGAALRAGGHDVDDEKLDRVLVDLIARHTEAWRSNEQYTYEQAVETMFEAIAVVPDDGLLITVTDTFTGRSSDFLPPLTPNIAAALDALRARGVRIGIICDVGLSPSVILRRHLDRHGVLGHFDHWSFSDEVGVYKPAPAIFDHALGGLGGVAAERAVHVGDLKATDVAGARRAGMGTVRYRGDNDDGDADGEDADVVIDDHVDLLAALGF
jgi:putative hydrolase of the HAD superfamily